MIDTDEWAGCYPSQWKGMIVPEATEHPAKFSSKLIRRIYDHMVAEGWLNAGDTVIDCFGGVALGAMDAMRLGLRWRGVELEAKFHDLGNRNIALWNSRFSTLPRWEPDAVTLHEHHALLVHAVAHTFDGEEKRRESKTFFRRLAENKGSPRIDYEVVLCMEKPQ